jgi:hypothetical protein
MIRIIISKLQLASMAICGVGRLIYVFDLLYIALLKINYGKHIIYNLVNQKSPLTNRLVTKKSIAVSSANKGKNHSEGVFTWGDFLKYVRFS